jgi:DNA mismatch repair protein MutS
MLFEEKDLPTTEKEKKKGPTVQTDTGTPLMKQYYQIKSKYPEAIMLFRIGDFYETFGEDAIKASQALGITLTKRNNGSAAAEELAGFPHHSLDVYLPKLVRAGYRVAICEQLEKPVAGRVVRRGVTEVITPGVTTDDKLLDHKANNFLASVYEGKKGNMGIAFLDISTGEFLVSEGDWAYMDKLLQSFSPSEVIFPKSKKADFEQRYGDKFYTFSLDEWVFSDDFALEKLLQHFEVQSLKGFGVEGMEAATVAAGATLHYLATTEKTNLKHILALAKIQPDRYVGLDRFTIRNLELVHSNHEQGTSLMEILDKTVSPMGARLLKKWVLLPLKERTAIESRLHIVTHFIENQDFGESLVSFIRQIGDLERLISKVPLGKVNPREVKQIQRALYAIEDIKGLLKATQNAQLQKIADGLNTCKVLRDMIENQLVAEPPVNLAKGGVMADGFNTDLDEYRNIMTNAKDLLLDIQLKESVRTGIQNLKIGYNSVFGYYLEVTNKYKDKFVIPDDWVRKQTMTTGERYITQELKTLETKILGAEEKILELEEKLFQALVSNVGDYIQPIQHNAQLVARLDCLLSFAAVATKQNYCLPSINDSLDIDIKEGRHPVIEQQLPLGEQYVPNDVFLSPESQQIMLITGPNMAGKSAFLRQTALIALMAQMGSYVPARSANIGIVDKIFTRVGASDNISSGESTFMVEMNETASIMNNISERSLILLDEIGRGTSTFDGISIAWSVAEYLHDNGIAAPKTLFATHYHELSELAEKFPRIHNFTVSVKETGQKVLFLRKVIEGASQRSFGIHVARMAGMPKSIVERANLILQQLEQKHISVETEGEATSATPIRQSLQAVEQPMQLKIFETQDPRMEKVKSILEEIDVNTMTPIEAMMKLNELKKITRKS